jgi:hypothetical protein
MATSSLADPIRVDFVSDARVTPGRLGLTFAPGRRDPKGRAARDIDADLERLRSRYRVDILLERGQFATDEFELLAVPDLLERVRARGIESLWFPIRDASVPTSMPATLELVGKLSEAIDRRRTVVVHCRAGMGRAGLIAASCLVARGAGAADAIAAVRAARAGAVEEPWQEAFIGQFERVWRSA